MNWNELKKKYRFAHIRHCPVHAGIEAANTAQAAMVNAYNMTATDCA